VRDASGGEVRGHTLQLCGLAGPFPALEDDEAPLPHRGHPSVMIELVAPRLIPSVIHWFTCTMTLSKFSFAASMR